VYALAGTHVLIALFVASVILAFAVMGICMACANRLDRSPRLRQFARNLAGYNLNAAQDWLARLAAFERGQ
jgi:predicted lysophospholipase L1 biosynthesis ABC-type transport system permease subunit